MNLIQKLLNFFKPKEKGFYEKAKAIDAILSETNDQYETLSTGPVPGWLVFSCNCGQSENVPVEDISSGVEETDLNLWKCPKRNCTQKVSLVERRPK